MKTDKEINSKNQPKPAIYSKVVVKKYNRQQQKPTHNV
jgi:hypothetical protein